MENHSYRYSDQYDVAELRKKRHRKKRQKSIWPVLSLGIVLAAFVGLAIRVGVFGQWANATAQATPTPIPEQSSTLAQSISLPESVTVQPLSLLLGQEVQAADFVTGLEGSGFSVSFASEPDLEQLGQQSIALLFTGEAGELTQTTSLYLYELINEYTVVMGSGQVADVRCFVPDPSVEASFVGLSPSQIPEQTCGVFELTVRCNGTDYPVQYIIGENVPPQGTGLSVTTTAGTLPPAETLVGDIQDHSDVTVSYLSEPDLTILGEQTVTMVLTDTYGNTAQVQAVLEVTPAPDGPRFTGLEELHIQVGSTISYKAGVTASDPEDGELTFSVDPGNVDAKTIGTYTAAYTATDSDGNTLTVYRTIVVQDEAAAAVEEYALNVLEQIITEDMTQDQKIYNVYLYTKSNVQFVGTSDKSSVVHGAYEGFSTGKGDCYTYYAMNKVMLDLLGIENLEVARIGGTSNHWWNLVLHEDGKYYHVDSCPKSIYLDGISYFHMTDTDLETYTYDEAVFAHRPNYYVYDKTLPEYQDIEIAP